MRLKTALVKYLPQGHRVEMLFFEFMSLIF